MASQTCVAYLGLQDRLPSTKKLLFAGCDSVTLQYELTILCQSHPALATCWERAPGGADCVTRLGGTLSL